MTLAIRLVLSVLLSTCLLACENNRHVDTSPALPQPNAVQQKWMEQSWSEYLVRVQDIALVEWQQTLKSKLSIKKVSLRKNKQYLVSLSNKEQYKKIYHALVQDKNIVSIQPNFHYHVPRPEKPRAIQ